MQDLYVSESKCKIETFQYRNERAMTFENFVRNLIKAVDELEKRGRGSHNSDIFETMWKRISDNELSQYITALKVQFQHQP